MTSRDQAAFIPAVVFSRIPQETNREVLATLNLGSPSAPGGIGAGHHVGRTDGIAGSVIEHPISPKDILATMFYVLGVDPRAMIYDRLGRPYQAAGEGEVVHEPQS